MSEEGVPLSEAMASMYMKLDAFAEAAAKNMGATCTKGCAHCCYLLALCGPSDGMVIAEHILNQENWKSWLPRLSKAAGAASYDEVNKLTYFRKKLPCAFLDLATNTCTVYEKRPACCRFHYVISKPENCSPHSSEGTGTEAIDLIQLEARTWDIDMQVATQELGLPMPPVAPIPVMVLWMMEMLTRGDLDRHGEIEKYCIGIPDPFKWAGQYANNLLEEGSGISKTVPFSEYKKEG